MTIVPPVTVNPTPPAGAGRFTPVDANPEAAEAFGRLSPPFQVVKIPLDVALDKKEYFATANTLWAIEASDNLAELSINYNDQVSGPVPFKNGSFIRGIPFSRLYITCLAQAGKWIKLAYTVEGPLGITIQNPAGNFSSISGSVFNTPVIPSKISTALDVICAAGVQTQLRAASITVVEVFVSSLSTNTGILRVGNAATAANKGIPLSPGETLILSATASVFAFNSNAAAQTVAMSVIEI